MGWERRSVGVSLGISALLVGGFAWNKYFSSGRGESFDSLRGQVVMAQGAFTDAQGRGGRSIPLPALSEGRDQEQATILSPVEKPEGFREEDNSRDSVSDKAEERSSDSFFTEGDYLGALSKQTPIYERPARGSRLLGYARTGSLLRRTALPVSKEGCPGGWFAIAPQGFVCIDRAATLNLNHPLLQLASEQPDRTLALPYLYGRSRSPSPIFYTRIPTQDQQLLMEKDWEEHSRQPAAKLWTDVTTSNAPPLLSAGQRIPRPYGYPQLKRPFTTGRALRNSTFSLIDLFHENGRSWGLTADLVLVALDRLVPVSPSSFRGLRLDGQIKLPVAFELSQSARSYRFSDQGEPLSRGAVPHRAAQPLSGRQRVHAGSTWVETQGGSWWKKSDSLRIVRTPKTWPAWASDGQTWVEVSLSQQVLIAYEGSRPVFVTLVSTGQKGYGGSDRSSSTIKGVFKIHTKHITANMSGDGGDDEFDLRDVPWVQYFHEGFALHSAFWHDSFGTARSHGCVNLSPEDAHYLFHWTEPAVPEDWHSALSREGTLVWVHR
ncbi:MAG: L,D-transpeptidase [Polyangiaceae bacterium]|nr:L,D-transpeptidase [Polyangiaceae bacterium]